LAVRLCPPSLGRQSQHSPDPLPGFRGELPRGRKGGKGSEKMVGGKS